MAHKPQIVIVGGGVMGAATACFLARDHGVMPIVIERDPAYLRASSALSASSIRQQFSVPINIQLSQASLAFYRNIGDELVVGTDRPDIALVEPGYLYLATTEGLAHMKSQQRVQRSMGADIALLIWNDSWKCGFSTSRMPWAKPHMKKRLLMMRKGTR